MWTARKILKELADSPRRREILAAFWQHAEPSSTIQAEIELANAMRFRHQKVRALPLEKKVDMLGTRLGVRDFETHLETALVAYLSHEQSALLSAFLDQWQIPHEDGAIEDPEVAPPTPEQAREAVAALEETFDRADIALYFATAGLVMGEGWREGLWPLVAELVPADG